MKTSRQRFEEAKQERQAKSNDLQAFRELKVLEMLDYEGHFEMIYNTGIYNDTIKALLVTFISELPTNRELTANDLLSRLDEVMECDHESILSKYERYKEGARTLFVKDVDKCTPKS